MDSPVTGVQVAKIIKHGSKAAVDENRPGFLRAVLADMSMHHCVNIGDCASGAADGLWVLLRRTTTTKHI